MWWWINISWIYQRPQWLSLIERSVCIIIIIKQMTNKFVIFRFNGWIHDIATLLKNGLTNNRNQNRFTHKLCMVRVQFHSYESIWNTHNFLFLYFCCMFYSHNSFIYWETFIRMKNLKSRNSFEWNRKTKTIMNYFCLNWKIKSTNWWTEDYVCFTFCLSSIPMSVVAYDFLIHYLWLFQLV